MELQDWEDDVLPERPLRQLCGTGTVEITVRTIHGRFLLKPGRDANEIIVGIFGRALEHHPAVLLHGFWVLSNHLTLLATFPNVKAMSDFMRFVNGNLARELGRLYAWRERFWGRRYRAIELADPERAVARLKYLLAQGTKEGIVSRPRDWPGISSLLVLLEGATMKGFWFDRTKEYRARLRGVSYSKYEFARQVTVPHAPLPCWERLSEHERREKVALIVREIETEGAERNAELGRTPMGVTKILAQDPHAHPERIAKSPAPLSHASTRDSYLAHRDRYLNFVRQFREAAKRLKAGLVEALAEFPPDCFLPRFPWRFVTPRRTALSLA